MSHRPERSWEWDYIPRLGVYISHVSLLFSPSLQSVVSFLVFFFFSFGSRSVSGPLCDFFSRGWKGVSVGWHPNALLCCFSMYLPPLLPPPFPPLSLLGCTLGDWIRDVKKKKRKPGESFTFTAQSPRTVLKMKETTNWRDVQNMCYCGSFSVDAVKLCMWTRFIERKLPTNIQMEITQLFRSF